MSPIIAEALHKDFHLCDRTSLLAFFVCLKLALEVSEPPEQDTGEGEGSCSIWQAARLVQTFIKAQQ